MKYLTLIFTCLIIACTIQKSNRQIGNLKISANGRYFCSQNGDPFFWLGDTGWLLFTKLTREEAIQYLDNRKQIGFNVIQVMLIHDVNSAVNVYGDSAIVTHDVATPKVTEGDLFTDSIQYDYWDHVDYVINQASKRNIYMALVPVWGGNVKDGKVNREQAATYSEFLADRYKYMNNIIWLNGGDIKGSDSIEIWKIIGNTLHNDDPNHLITFHPRGRMISSDWFHNEPWLSFNMCQSGHRRYDQDDTKRKFGEDNWKYIESDYARTPVKPTLDGEPSYEDIPQGLHDTLQPLWKADDVRRYAYWSVFAGACGFTYGNNSVMQFKRTKDKVGDFGAKRTWTESLNDSGACQMIYLKNLILSKPYFERTPDQTFIANNGEKYNYIAATRSNDFAFIYTYSGRTMAINMGYIKGDEVKASWYNPRNGSSEEIGIFNNKGVISFNPPEEERNGNDWVLVLESE